MRQPSIFKLLAVFLSLGSLAPLNAEVRLPKLISSGMVLQRNSKIKIWGSAAPNEKVTITGDWLKQPVSTSANANGQWNVQVATGDAGGPHQITVAGSNKIKLDDILFGEVWLASGQSNMEMPLTKVSGAYTGIKDADKEVGAARYPSIRLFQVGNFSSKKPLDDVESGITMYGIPPAKCQWQACSPDTIPHFASTAYFFARSIHQQLKVPVGIIDASWGGTPAEAWTPVAGLKRIGLNAEAKAALTLPQKANQKIPARLYNGMIHPLRKFKIRGAIWYQGEGNARRAAKYRQLFSTMIQEWRKVFGDTFSFYFVQISPFRYRGLNSAFLREAQLQTMSVPKTGMAVTMDIGNLTDIHPKNKQEVGRRLALWALAKDYGKNVVYSGPVFESIKLLEQKIEVSFSSAKTLLTSDQKPPSHFEIAGEDRVFHPATAKIDGNRVLVSSPKVPRPIAVRYAFSNQAMPNLMNQAKLPASSFRSDRW